MSTERRQQKAPLNVLNEKTQCHAHKIQELLVLDFDSMTLDQLQQTSTTITESKSLFESASRELEERYREIGSKNESRTTKKQRLDISRELYSTLQEINAIRRAANLEDVPTCNPADQQSLFTVMTKRPETPNNEWSDNDHCTSDKREEQNIDSEQDLERPHLERERLIEQERRLERERLIENTRRREKLERLIQERNDERERHIEGCKLEHAPHLGRERRVEER